jgi:hypothetical protein
MMVFLVLVVIPLPDEDVPSAERTAVEVPVVMATEVEDETAVVRLPDMVITVVYTTMLLDVDVYSDVEVIEEEVLVVFGEVEDVVGVLEGVEDGVELVVGGVELVVGGVEEGVLLGVLLGLADVGGVDVAGVDDGVDDGVDEVEGVELTADEVVCDCVASGLVPLVLLAETALISF